MVAGVIALMVEASSHSLSRVEMAHILVESSSIPSTLEHECVMNGAGYLVHPQVCLKCLSLSPSLPPTDMFTSTYQKRESQREKK